MFTRDFEPFLGWEKVSVGNAPIEGHPAGQRYIYVNHRRPAGSVEWPQGTIIVKVVEVDGATDKSQWDLFAMVKRGGDYNALAKGWEFFTLGFGVNGVLGIKARGVNAANHGYTDNQGNELHCTDCHGALGAATDHVISPALINFTEATDAGADPDASADAGTHD